MTEINDQDIWKIKIDLAAQEEYNRDGELQRLLAAAAVSPTIRRDRSPRHQ